MADKFGRETRLPRNFQGSLTCRKSVTWERRLYFPSEGRRAEDFFARKIQRLRLGLNPRSWVPEASTLTNMWGSMYFIKMFCRNGCNCCCKHYRKVVSVKCVCNRNWHIATFLFITSYLFEHFSGINFTSVLNGDDQLITYMTLVKMKFCSFTLIINIMILPQYVNI